MDDTIRVVVAEDHPLVLDGIRRALESAPSIRLLAEAADGQTALERIRSLRPDVAVLDIQLPRLNGLAIARCIRDERLPVEIVFLTIHDDEATLEEAFELGAKGYLLKDCTSNELLRCIHAVAAGQHCTHPSMTTYIVNKARRVEQFTRTTGVERLTKHEREILAHIKQRKSSKEIAHELGVEPRSVHNMRARICQKLGLRGQYALSRFVARYRQDL
jgi:DNA-binding NarL/FixJ family response regulator